MRILVHATKERKWGRTSTPLPMQMSSVAASLYNSTATAVRRGWLIGFWRRTTAVARGYAYLPHSTHSERKSCIKE